LFVEAAEPHGLQGRPVFADFATDAGSVGVPADSRGVVSVGAVDSSDRPHPASALGPPANLDGVRRPNIFSYADIQPGTKNGGAYGTSLATSFAAGSTAVLLSSGSSPSVVEQFLQRQNGVILHLAPAKK
jgi:hypothetical protein